MTKFTDFTEYNKLKGARIASNYKETDDLVKSLDGDIEKGGAGSRGGKVIGYTKSGKPIYGKKWISHSNVDKIYSQHPEIEDPHYAGRTHIGPGITRESQIFDVKAGDKTYLVHSSPYDGDFWYEKDDNVKKSEPELQQAMITGSTPGKETATKDNVIIKATDDQQAKMKKVMDEWKAGTLKTSAGEKVTDHKQAIAIGLSEAGLSKAQATGKELDDLIEEHKNLIAILESPSHEDDKEEVEDQKKELKHYEKLAKAFDVLGLGDDVIEKATKGMIGEVRTWGGKKYKKQPNGKWVEVSEHGMTKKEHHNKMDDAYDKADRHTGSGRNDAHDEAIKHKHIASKLSDKEHSDEEVGLKSSKHISDMSKEEKHSAAEKMGVKGHEKMTEKELDKHLSDKNVEKQVKEFKEKKDGKQKPKYITEAGVGQHLVQTSDGILQYSGDEMKEIFGGVNKLEDAETNHKEIKNIYSGKSDKYLGKHPDGDHWVKHSSGNVSRYSNDEMSEVYGEKWNKENIKKSDDSTDLQKAFETLGLEDLIEKGGQGSGRKKFNWTSTGTHKGIPYVVGKHPETGKTAFGVWNKQKEDYDLHDSTESLESAMTNRK